ncbi:hypothetical protein [Actinomadura roseirufa]|uniref:hypothetical protein n=1 Tax=Actinomadura roseirufa TaxID=2094049 RepID=UPI001041B646|nr:hypothetical protein [Actinomadura roseirufa]
MNRSARSLLGVSVLVPLATALAAALPANAVQGPAAGPVRQAAGAPLGRIAARPVPKPVGKAADAVDGVLREARDASALRTGAAADRRTPRRCTLDSGKALKGTGTPLPGKAKMTLSVPERRAVGDDCLGKKRGRAALPAPIRPSKVTGGVLKGIRNLKGGHLGKLGAVTKKVGRTLAERHAATGRHAAPEPGGSLPLGSAATLGLPSIPSAVRTLEAAGVPLPSKLLFPPARRHAGRAPAAHHRVGRPGVASGIVTSAGRVIDTTGRVIDTTGRAIDTTGDGIDDAQSGIGHIAEVLKTDDRPVRPRKHAARPGKHAFTLGRPVVKTGKAVAKKHLPAVSRTASERRAARPAADPLTETLRNLPALSGLRGLPIQGVQGVKLPQLL